MLFRSLAMPAAHVWVEQDSEERRERKQQREIDRRKSALSAVEFLKPLRPDEIALVADQLRYAPFSAGETITKQGAVAHWLYILVEGVDKAVARIEAPGFFGEMGLMTGAPRTATVIAATDVVSYRLDKEAFRAIVLDRPEMTAEISQLLAQRGIELQAAREDLDGAAREKRVAAESQRILRTIERFFGLTDERGAA